MSEHNNNDIPKIKMDLTPGNRPVKKKKASKKKLAIIIVCSIVAILLIAYLAARILFHIYYEKMNQTDYVTTEFVEEGPSASDSDAEDIAKLDEELEGNKDGDLMSSEDVTNILLIGNDSREKNVLGRSDSMIILSINEKSKKIVLTSIMRDCYVSIPGHGNTRINAAYAFGGPDLLIETIEENFKIKIDSYVGINFEAFVYAVDTIGGVTIEVKPEEVSFLNDNLHVYNQDHGMPLNDEEVRSSGMLTLTGKQAISFARIRHVGNSDYERTERQRRILEELIVEAKGSSVSELNRLLKAILPEVTTDISESDMIDLMTDYATTYKNYKIESCRVPVDDSITNLVINGADVLGIDFEQNIDYLKENIFE